MKNDLYYRLDLVKNALISCLPAKEMYIPTGYEAAHNIGRWWEAVLLMEYFVGMVIPPQIEKAMKLNLYAFMNNPYGLLLNPREILGNGCLNHHNLREGLLALSALAKFRNSRWAVNCGEKMLDTINRRFFTGELSETEMCSVLDIPINSDPMITRPEDDPFRDEDYTPSTGRAIEGMFRFYTVTGSERALSVMQKAVKFHRAHSINDDGSAPEWLISKIHVGHNHSYLGTLRGLLLYGLHFGDSELVNAVNNTYQKSIWKNNCSYSGFAPHDLGKLRFPDHLGDPFGDHASCTDIAYIAFLLASRGGHPELFDDTERLIRARLFRSQVSAGTEIGSWGTYDGYFGAGVVMDVFALIAGTLAMIYDQSVVKDEDGIRVRMHFSNEKPFVSVTAFRDKRQHIFITPKESGMVHIRVPSWCDIAKFGITDEENNKIDFEFDGVFASAYVNAEQTIEASFELPIRESVETTWISNTSYRIIWKGDEITSVDEVK